MWVLEKQGTKKYKLNYVWWLITPDIPCFRMDTWEGVWQYYRWRTDSISRAFIFYNTDFICKNCTTINFLHWPQCEMLEKHNVCVFDQGLEKCTMHILCTRISLHTQIFAPVHRKTFGSTEHFVLPETFTVSFTWFWLKCK